MVEMDGGEFLMGAPDPIGYPDDGELPVHPVELRPFAIDRYAVSNERFGEFVGATGLRDRGRTVRLVVRVRRLASRRVPRNPGGGDRAVVATGVRRGLAPSRGP